MFKKAYSLILIACFTLTMALAPVGMTPTADAADNASYAAVRAGNAFFVGENRVTLRAYVIGESIYIDLFELALRFSGTEKRFSPSWGLGMRTVRITTGRAYTAIGVRTSKPVKNNETAKLSDAIVYADGVRTSISSYVIDGETYFNLREISKLLDFKIVTNSEDNAIILEINMPYGEASLRNIDPELPMVAVTYDDGPSKITTDAILDILGEHDAVATFFVTGSSVRANPDTLLRAFEMGNEIGNHTMAHINLRTSSVTTGVAQLLGVNELVEGITGVSPRFMRPPFGEVGANGREVSTQTKMPMIMWAIDPSDYLSENSPQYIVDFIFARVKDGDIILLHDTSAKTATTTGILIPALIEKGFQLVTVSELFYYKEIEPVAAHLYRNIRSAEK
ncbi:MAG: polysaccharide deacetylase family protein [Oscillospiraceae bacterium]|nr:polysaccharide deacetylase family protein [Oscillospiraceae bacterium]